MKVFCLLVVALELVQMCVGSKHNLRRRLNVLQNPCGLLHKVHRDGNVETDEVVCQLMGSDVETFGALIVSIDGVTPEWAIKNNVISGKTTLFGEGATIDGNKLVIPGEYILGARDDNRRTLAQTTGPKSVLAVRVVASDSSTTSGASTLSDSIFGTNGDSVNMVSQYKACSDNKLQFSPTTLHSNGVYTVNINRNVKSQPESNVEQWVTQQLESDLGATFQNDYDHVMYCLPAGVGSGTWIGYAYINHWLSIFNDVWCERVTSQMHEIGHNLGLAHSGETNGYDDQSGIMGFSYFEDDGPKMCFNGAKSWQLGWYSDKHDTATPLTKTWNGNLVGVADYKNAGTKAVILKVEGDGSVEYFVTFNHMVGSNAETREGGNQVLVTRTPQGDEYAESTLVAKLNSGETYKDSDFGGRPMTIKVNTISSAGLGGAASASITVSSTASGASLSCMDYSDAATCQQQGCKWDDIHQCHV